MSGGYSQYPSNSGTTGSTAAVLIAFSVGALDGQAATPKGASISSASVFLQSATALSPGLVSSASQTFSGAKTFGSMTFTISSASWYDGAARPTLYVDSKGASALNIYSTDNTSSSTADIRIITGQSLANDGTILTTGGIQLRTGPNSAVGTSAFSSQTGPIWLQTGGMGGQGTDTQSGALNLFTGAHSGTGSSSLSGTISIQTGGAGNASGDIALRTGQADRGTGYVTLTTGDATGSFNVGGILITTGGTATGITGDIELTTGNTSGAGTSGNINLIAGSVVGGTRGEITLTGSSVSISSILNLNSHRITQVTDPTGAQDAATKNYVDSQLAAFEPKEAVSVATVGANLVGTYVNGIAGVGATLTITATGAFALDGVTPAAASRILIKDQSSGLENGVYDLTVAGSVGVSPILTRSLDYNTALAIDAGDLIPVISGTVNQKTSWLQTATVTTVGTDALVFTKYSSNPSNIAIAMGAIDTAAASANGGAIGSSSLYLQSASASNPGLVSSAAQTFAGVKTFNSAPIMSALSTSAPVLTTSSGGQLTSGSISLTANVTGILPLANMSATSGSVTHTSSAGGAAYTVRWPGTQASGGTFLVNDGKGNLAWQYPFGPVSVKTANYIVGSSDTVILVGSGTSFVTLPPSENIQGQEFVVKKTFSSLETVILNTTSSETFDGGLTSFSLDFKNEMIVVQSAGSGSSQSNWLTTGYSSPTFFMTPTVSTSFSINYINCCLYKAATTGGSVSWFGSLTADLNSTAAGTTFNVNVSSGAFTFSGAGSYFQTLNGINLSNNGLVQYCRANGDSIIQTVCTTSPTLTRFGFSGTLKMQKPLTAL